jgi:integrase
VRSPLGTLQDYPTEASARKSDAVQAIILRINAEHPLGPVTASTVGGFDRAYEKEELPSRYSTRASCQSYLDNYIRPRWGEVAIASVRAMAVEDWLKRLTLAPKTRGHIRSLMSTLFKCAQRWELVENNPMQLVHVRNVSKRPERPSVLTAEEVS